MNAKEFLANKGVHNLDTKKRYNEVIAWMEEYAALRQPPVMRSLPLYDENGVCRICGTGGWNCDSDSHK